ncbi:MAG: hypothetical protein AB7Q00_15975 [Phycisphaerales bacterium]
MDKKIRIKAAKNAPEFVAHGNLGAENKRGFFETTDRRFADHIVASGYGTEAAEKPQPDDRGESKTRKPKAAKAEKPAEVADEKTEGGTE